MIFQTLYTFFMCRLLCIYVKCLVDTQYAYVDTIIHVSCT